MSFHSPSIKYLDTKHLSQKPFQIYFKNLIVMPGVMLFRILKTLTKMLSIELSFLWYKACNTVLQKKDTTQERKKKL